MLNNCCLHSKGSKLTSLKAYSAPPPKKNPAATTRSLRALRALRSYYSLRLSGSLRSSFTPITFFLDPPLMPVTYGWKITILIIQVCRKITEIYFASAGRKIFCRTLLYGTCFGEVAGPKIAKINQAEISNPG